MFRCSNIHRALSDTWREHQKIKATSVLPPAWLTFAYELRQRMIHFVQNLQHYTCFEVWNAICHITLIWQPRSTEITS